MPTSWTDRFTLHAQELWRELQDALRDGNAHRAASAESRLRMVLGVTADRELSEKQLHRAAYQTRSSPPDLIPVENIPPKGGMFPAGEEPAPPPASPSADLREVPQPSKTTDAELLELHRQTQAAISRYGSTRHTRLLQYDLERCMARDLHTDLSDREKVERDL